MVEREIGSLYADRAQHVVDAANLEVKSLVDAMQLATSIFAVSEEDKGLFATQKLITAAKAELGTEAWLGIIDPTGIVIADDGDRIKGTYLGDSGWFKKALAGEHVSEDELFPELTKTLGTQSSNSPENYLLIILPMKKPTGEVIAYTAAAFDMDLIQNIVLKSTKSLVASRAVDVFLIDSSGADIIGNPDGVIPLDLNTIERLKQSVKTVDADDDSASFVTADFLVGYAHSRALSNSDNTGWIAVVREAKVTAFQPAHTMSTMIALTCLAMGLGLTVAAALGLNYILAGLSTIASSADQLRQGTAKEFVAQKGQDEVSRISVSLASLFNNQKKTNDELFKLNQNLDQKVLERTREVQRLSDETRNAAITRDRLRMSRDLHDTLAHTMLAMLTQIRYMHKLYKSKPDQLSEEFGYAEQAAQEGLNLARDAVTELRYFAVRDDGLGAAIDKLVKRLKERIEIEVAVNIDKSVSSLAGAKAETIFRIAEEALHNIEKHAEAQNVKIEISLDQSDPINLVLKLSIEDDGKGFETQKVKRGHFGLLGMQEQADVLGAKLRISSTPNAGTIISIEVTL